MTKHTDIHMRETERHRETEIESGRERERASISSRNWLIQYFVVLASAKVVEQASMLET